MLPKSKADTYNFKKAIPFHERFDIAFYFVQPIFKKIAFFIRIRAYAAFG